MVKINLSLLCNHLRRHLKCIKTDPTTSINIGMIDLCDKANFRRMKWIPVDNEVQLIIIINEILYTVVELATKYVVLTCLMK